MNKIIIILALITLSFFSNTKAVFSQCAQSTVLECSKQTEGASVIQAFNIELEKTEPEQRSFSKNITFVLEAGKNYRFNFGSDEIKTKEMRVNLFKAGKSVKNNFSKGQFSKSFDFKAKEKGIYTLFIENTNNNPGCVVAILSEIKPQTIE